MIFIHVNYPLFLSDFNKTLIYETDFQKILNKNRPLGAEVFNVVGRMDRRSEVAFRHFASMRIIRTHAFHCLASISFRISREDKINGYKAHLGL
jgi:hypothetical protein